MVWHFRAAQVGAGQQITIPIASMPPIINMPSRCHLICDRTIGIATPELSGQSLGNCTAPGFGQLGHGIGNHRFAVLGDKGKGIALHSTKGLPVAR